MQEIDKEKLAELNEKNVSSLSYAEMVGLLSGINPSDIEDMTLYTLLNRDDLTDEQEKSLKFLKRFVAEVNMRGLSEKVLSPKKSYQAILKALDNDYKDRECFVVCYLHQSHGIIETRVESVGMISAALVDVKLIMKRALILGASKIIIAHSHPSSSLNPSDEDKKLTDNIKAAAMYFNISLLDHIILNEHRFYSFAENGLI